MHINQTQIKTWLACQQKWAYRHGMRLVPRAHERPLYIGSWGHKALETYYRDGDWMVGFKEYEDQYNKLFEEERRSLDKGDEPLPSQLKRILFSYFLQYQDDGWTALAVERDWRVNVETKKGIIPLGGKVDILIIDADGLIWVVDNKFVDTIPDKGAFHVMDQQLVLYPWGIENDPSWQDVLQGRPIAGVIYNYIRSAAPSIPKRNKDGSLSKSPISTDYWTVQAFLISNGMDPANYSELLDELKESQKFLLRYRLPRSPVATNRTVFESLRTARDILSHRDTVRNVSFQCGWCAYSSLCRADLFGLDTKFLIRTRFTVEKDAEELSPQGGVDGEPHPA